MKKKRPIIGHIIGSLILILLYELFLFGRDFSFYADRGTDFIVSNFILTPLHYFAYLVISVLPLIIIIHLSYKKKIRQIFVLPAQIIAALFIPLALLLPDYLMDQSWEVFFDMVILTSNVILFIFNRIYYQRLSRGTK